MLDHAVGALNSGLHVAASLHVNLSNDGAGRSALWDIVGGALLEQDNRALRMASPPRKRAAAPCEDAVDKVLSTDLSILKWKHGLSGAGVARTGLPGSHFMRLDPGQNVPAHSHSAMEATVVLDGELEVDGEVFSVGDITLGVPGEVHRPAAHGHRACICFVARGNKPFWRLT